ncbi:hypothetical protein EMIT0111MI5_30498 [Burkholderia sp. IT-111MI5]
MAAGKKYIHLGPDPMGKHRLENGVSLI